MGHNRESFGALLKNIMGNLKSIIGSGLLLMVTSFISSALSTRDLIRRLGLLTRGVTIFNIL